MAVPSELHAGDVSAEIKSENVIVISRGIVVSVFKTTAVGIGSANYEIAKKPKLAFDHTRTNS